MGDDDDKKLQIDTLKLVGYFFEKSDCALRNHNLKDILHTFKN